MFINNQMVNPYIILIQIIYNFFITKIIVYYFNISFMYFIQYLIICI